MSSDYLTDIHALVDAGYRVIPVGDNKVPVIQGWPTHPGLTHDEVNEWFEGERFHVGVLTGNGFGVIDIDDEDAWDELCKTSPVACKMDPTVTTRSGGTHIYFRYDTETMKITNANTFPKGIDVRGDGGYVVCPPSPGYRWV